MRKTLALLLIAGCASAPPPKPAEENDPDDPMVQLRQYCSTHTDCRHDVSITVRRAGKPPMVKNFELLAPSVQPPSQEEPTGRVTIYPGDTLNVEAEIVGAEVHVLRSVPKVEHPERTFVMKFAQDDGAFSMTLSVKNPFEGKPIKFYTFPLYADKITARVVQASSCPMMPNITNYVNWTEPIAVLVMVKPRVLPPGDPLKCD